MSIRREEPTCCMSWRTWERENSTLLLTMGPQSSVFKEHMMSSSLISLCGITSSHLIDTKNASRISDKSRNMISTGGTSSFWDSLWPSMETSRADTEVSWATGIKELWGLPSKLQELWEQCPTLVELQNLWSEISHLWKTKCNNSVISTSIWKQGTSSKLVLAQWTVSKSKSRLRMTWTTSIPRWLKARHTKFGSIISKKSRTKKKLKPKSMQDISKTSNTSRRQRPSKLSLKMSTTSWREFLSTKLWEDKRQQKCLLQIRRNASHSTWRKRQKFSKNSQSIQLRFSIRSSMIS